jgi:phosphatidylglycerol---prolipoprotein diacylglyceryl transferase
LSVGDAVAAGCRVDNKEWRLRPVLFHCRAIPIYSYPAFLYLGIVLGIYAQLAAALSVGVDVWRTLGATLLLLAAALFGARMLFVVQHWHHYRGRLRAVWRYTDGGAAMYGGLLALPLSIPLLALLSIPWARFWDLASFTLLVGLVVTRIGCFLNGCCAGRASSSWLSFNLPDHRGVWRRRIPVQMLEGAWATVVLAGAAVLWRRIPFQGALFFYTIGAYGAGRFLLESWREEQDRVRGISVHAAVSALLVVASVGFFVSRWR